MIKKEMEKFICPYSMTVVEAMKKIDANSSGLLYVVDDGKALIGCVTDGDIRRWIIRGGALDAEINEAMNTSPVSVPIQKKCDAFSRMQEKQIASIAVVDGDFRIADILFLSPKMRVKRGNGSLKGTPVVVMAGGKGTRLHPFTKILPKPLIPIGEVPILERILDRFAEYGVRDFYLTVHYRKEMIKSYFAESAHAYSIHYVEEKTPLGTAGSIRLIKKAFDGPVIVTNCDILIEADYADIMGCHVQSGNDLTIVSSLKNTVIPYGVLHAKENGVITSMEEKPEVSHFINTGMYVVKPEFIDWIPEDKVFHMTDLAGLMMEKGRKVGMYPVSENSFLDMGEFAQMKRMEERVNAGFME